MKVCACLTWREELKSVKDLLKQERDDPLIKGLAPEAVKYYNEESKKLEVEQLTEAKALEMTLDDFG